MFGLGFWELAIILLVAFLALGPSRLPSLAKTIGKGLRDLRRASEDLRSSIQEPLDEIRRPLQDLRDELAETVHSVGAEIEREATQPTPEQQKELEDRRREVDELYAGAAGEDALTEDERQLALSLDPPGARAGDAAAGDDPGRDAEAAPAAPTSTPAPPSDSKS